MTRRARTAALTLAALACCPLAACSSGDQAAKPPAKVNAHATTLREGFTDMDGLVHAAKEEGQLTLIGVSRDRVNLGALVNRFGEQYGIDVRLAEPEASSGRQIEAAKRVNPDVFDLRLDVAVANAGHFAPYRVATWDDIPDDLKDPGGAWYSAYGGYISIGYDSRKVSAPASFDDLLHVGKGVKVALPGDPRQVAAAFDGVMASALADGWPKPPRGVEYFAELRKRHRLAPPDRATVLIDWDHANLHRGATAGAGKSAWKVVVPRGAVLAGYQVQAINKKAPHPAAARLWQEFLFSDEAQNLLLKGYARPVRMEALEMRGTLDTGAAAKLPKADGEPVVLTVPQTDEGRTYLRGHWTAAVK